MTVSHHLHPQEQPSQTPVSTAQNVVRDEQLVKPLSENIIGGGSMERTTRMVIYGVYGLLVSLGVLTGYVLSKQGSSTLGVSSQKMTIVKTDKVAGVSDTQTFKDSAVGILEKGGIDGEGTHKLIRDGGPSQTAFLVSSVVDLDDYTGKKLKVWGQTFSAKKAAWLMDVGKVEVQE